MTELREKPDVLWEKVERALSNPSYDFRTVKGIARETDRR